MLEQAIIDAEALKEAAIKNAEQAVLEKYAGEINNAVETLLEQDEEELFGAEDEMGLGDESSPENRDSVADQLEMAATNGENACPCPEDSQPIVLDLDQIVAQAEAGEDTESTFDDEVEDTEEELREALVDYFNVYREQYLRGSQYPVLFHHGDMIVNNADIRFPLFVTNNKPVVFLSNLPIGKSLILFGK